MNHRFLIGVFTDESDILDATRAARGRGWRIADVYAPYAVHGLDKAMGLAPSRLPWVCFLLGLFGAGAKVWFEYWTTSMDWPVNVGGKPWNSLPAFVPITFEVMVLFAGISTVIAFFLVAGLRPWRKAQVICPGVTNDRFALVIEESDAAFDVAEARSLLEAHGAFHIEEREEGLVAPASRGHLPLLGGR
jgi:hypothetical protein